MNYDRRSFLKTASALLLGALPSPISQLPNNPISLAASNNLLELCQSFIRRKLEFSATIGTVPLPKTVLDDITTLNNFIPSLLDSVTLPNQNSRNYVPPEYFLLKILGTKSLWNDTQPVPTPKEFGVLYSTFTEELNKQKRQSDGELRQTYSDIICQIENIEQFQLEGDPLLSKIVQKTITDARSSKGAVEYLRGTLDFLGKLIPDFSTSNQKINGFFESIDGHGSPLHPDTISFLTHFRENGFQPFPEGSRLANLQQLARLCADFKKLATIPEEFLKSKDIAAKIKKFAEELEFKLPEDNAIKRSLFSETFEESERYQFRSFNGEALFDRLNNLGLPSNFCLIHHHLNGHNILQIYLPEEKRILPLHVTHHPNLVSIFKDILWSEYQDNLSFTSERSFFAFNYNSESYQISPITSLSF